MNDHLILILFAIITYLGLFYLPFIVLMCYIFIVVLLYTRFRSCYFLLLLFSLFVLFFVRFFVRRTYLRIQGRMQFLGFGTEIFKNDVLQRWGRLHSTQDKKCYTQMGLIF